MNVISGGIWTYLKSLADPTIPPQTQREAPWTKRAQRKQVEYRSHLGSRWPCTFHVVCVNVIHFLVEYGLRMRHSSCHVYQQFGQMFNLLVIKQLSGN